MMGRIPAPTRNVGAVIDALGTGEHFDEVKAVRVAMVEGEAELRVAASASSAASTAREHKAISEVDEEHVKWIWSSQFSGRKGRAGQLYDQILTSAIEGLCPICGKREADEIDHHLPKSKYPRLSIVPLNMVPMCHKCNNVKRTFVASKGSEEPFHPYFDDFGATQWLVAETYPRAGAPLKFSIDADPNWGSDVTARVEFWFEKLQLAALYSQSAGGILSGLQLTLEWQEARGGAAAIRSLLSGMAASWEHSGTQAWMSASYRGWAQSDYFCEGGWRV